MERAVSQEILRKLSGIRNTGEIRQWLAGLCRPYGEIVRIEIEPDGDDAYICLVDMATAAQNAALVRELGGFSYGLGVGFRIPMIRDD